MSVQLLVPGLCTCTSLQIAQIKQWLTDAGEEQLVWDLANRKAKKEDWVAAVKGACGQ